ncbi:hypothetical protein [Raoultibacter timonensis]|uniref:Uncharacterized protein n=1 Tax=Raoultibacter timonensis TaxID=1907662 RepID=A0ABM7WKI7_9ACTN|nr:hypothetical protein [Raoultibacter timonensis]BDE96833.1 hypothetical protein CE91St30_21660 [Raoultibacter timonensis]BDF51436.1 hypothetical protein CE91St31_21660 [Raoultibacter timonensis]
MGDGMCGSIKEQIVASSEKSLEFLAAIRGRPNDVRFVSENLKAFVLHRFFLVDENPSTEDIAELSRLSIEKLLEVNRQGALQDLSNNCAGVSSETMKKALLIMTLQKKLDVSIPAEENDTVSQIAAAIVRQLAQPGR